MAYVTYKFLKCPDGDWDSSEVKLGSLDDDGSIETDYRRHAEKHRVPAIVVIDEREAE